MAAAAKHNVFVTSDSDIRLDRRDSLLRVVAGFADPQVGVVTCPYRSLPDAGFVNTLGMLHIALSGVGVLS
jgi:ceramide glucosyltransferase